jgi:hypothetical protein
LKASFATALWFDENTHQMRSEFSDNSNDRPATAEKALEIQTESREINEPFTNQPLVHQATLHKPWVQIGLRVCSDFRGKRPLMRGRAIVLSVRLMGV